MKRPYIGLTGFVHPDEVTAVAPPALASHEWMCGVLVSRKTLRSGHVESRRYPFFGDVDAILARASTLGMWPVVHYNSTSHEGILLSELLDLRDNLPHMRGLQLNMDRPLLSVVRAFAQAAPSLPLILQVRDAPTAVVDVVSAYAPFVRYALLDRSQGTGLPLEDLPDLAAVLDAWPFENVFPVVAGGLGPDAGAQLAVLRTLLGASAFRDLSFDAESHLRTESPSACVGEKGQDDLDPRKARAWAELMATMLGASGAGAPLVTGLRGWDRAVGGELRRGTRVILTGGPATGKSALAMTVLARLAKAGHRVLYVAGEDTPQSVQERAESLGLALDANFLIAPATSWTETSAAVHATCPDVVVLDSVQRLARGGGNHDVQRLLADVARLAASPGAPCLILLQHKNKAGLLVNTSTHEVDTILDLAREGSSFILRPLVHRAGTPGPAAVLHLTDRGFVDADESP